MAGLVKAQRQLSLEGAHLYIRPDICPVEALNRTMPACMAVAIEDSHMNVCPFWYGLRLFRGGTVYDLRGTAGTRWWLTPGMRAGDHYEVLCLRRESHGTEVGAKLRP